MLTGGALELVGRLHEELDDTRVAGRDARRQRQAELDAGGTLDFVTADIGGSAGTADMGSAVAERVAAAVRR